MEGWGLSGLRGPLWAGLGSLGPKGSLSGPGWGRWGLSLVQAGVSGTPGVAIRARMGSLGPLGSLSGSGWGLWDPWGLYPGKDRVSGGLSLGLVWVSEAFGTPRVFTFSVLAFPGPLGCLSGRAGVSVVSGSLFQGQAGVSGVFLWAKLGSLGSLGSLSGPGWGLWNPWGLCPGQDGVSGTPGVSIRVRMGSLGPLGSLSGQGPGLWGSLSRPGLGL